MKLAKWVLQPQSQWLSHWRRSIRMEFSLPGYSSHATAFNNPDGAYAPELTVKLGQQ